MKWAWVAVIAVIVAAAGIFAFRTLNAPDAGDVVVQTVQPTREPVPTTTTTTSAGAFADPNPGQATKVITVVAVGEAGDPAAGYQVSDGGEVMSCHGSSNGIVGCSPTAAGADVCWVTPTPRVLLCGTSPWEKSLRKVTADEVDQEPLGEEAQPWGLELADGAKCQRRNGGSWPGRSDGLAGAYFCDREHEFVLAGDGPLVNRTQPAWTVRIGDLGESDASFPPPADMRVVTAYFAASA